MKLHCLIFLSILFAQTAWARQTDQVAPKGEHQAFWEDNKGWESTQPKRPAPAGYLVQPFQQPVQRAALTKEIFGYLPYWFRDRWNLLDYQLVTTIAYFSAEAAPDGTIGDTHGWPRFDGDPSANASVLSMITTAHQNGVRVVLCVTLFDANGIHTLVTDSSYRVTFIQTMIDIVQGGNGDGININFEGFLAKSRDSVTTFMKQLADSFHVRIPGSQVSCAPTDYDTRSGDWDIAAIEPSIDLFFFQGYGYGWSGSPTTRPVGLLPNTPFWGSLNETTLIDFVLARIPPDKVLLGVPHYGRIWAAASPNPNTTTLSTGTAFYYPDALGYIASHGRQWDDQALNPWFRYQDGSLTWFQGWYDDPESMSYKYQFALSRDLAGIGMWSLGMDGSNHDIWDVIAQYFADSTFVQPPHQPILSLVKDTSTVSEGRAIIQWTATQPSIGGFRLYRSLEPTMSSPTLVFKEDSLGPSARSALVTGLGLDTTYYFRLEAVSVDTLMFSDPTDTYGVRTGAGPRYLIVDGFTRSTASYTLPSHSLSSAFATPLEAVNVWFDNASRDAVGRNEISMNAYDGVFWFAGDNSSADRSLGPTHQAALATYLENGGKLFITGSELGYDLDRSASANYNHAWFAAYLKASYGGDKAAGLSYAGSMGSAFQGVSGTFGEVYLEDYPDYITPAGGAVKVLEYNATQIAGIAYEGHFGTGTEDGKLVYLGFTFESIISLPQRTDLVQKTIAFFNAPIVSSVPLLQLPTAFGLDQNYPNPFNPATVISYQLSVSSRVSLRVYDILGREVATLVSGEQPAGVYKAEWNASVASGVYFYRLEAVRADGRRFVETRKMLLAR